MAKDLAIVLNNGSISSAVTTLYPPGSSTYTATKAAVDAITVILSKELGAKGIRVNAINPGMIETEGVHSAGFLGSDFQKGIEALWIAIAPKLGCPLLITAAASSHVRRKRPGCPRETKQCCFRRQSCPHTP